MCNKCNNSGPCGCVQNEPLGCGCESTPEVPEYVCPNPEPCVELVDDRCVVHTTETIACEDLPPGEDDAYSNYPDVIHHVVKQNDTIGNRKLPKMLGNINDQLCYIFSKEFISRFLTLIDTDVALKTQFCTMVCSCDCEIEPCLAPVSLTRTIDCQTGITVWNWDDVAGATGYEYEWERSGGIGGINGSGTTSVSTVTLYNLGENDCLTFRVRTLCGENSVSEWTYGQIACCPIPEACTISPLTVTPFCAGSYISYTWTPVSGAIKYEFEYYYTTGSTISTITTISKPLPAVPAHNVPNVGVGTCVTARVRVQCGDGTYSAWSAWSTGCCG